MRYLFGPQSGVKGKGVWGRGVLMGEEKSTSHRQKQHGIHTYNIGFLEIDVLIKEPYSTSH